jgi:hypothetical protein
MRLFASLLEWIAPAWDRLVLPVPEVIRVRSALPPPVPRPGDPRWEEPMHAEEEGHGDPQAWRDVQAR